MERDYALRIDSLLTSVRASLDSIASYMRNSIGRGAISDDEFKRLVQYIGRSMGETVKMSNELYRIFPDIVPEELKNPPKKS